jgi:hypothetical protein
VKVYQFLNTLFYHTSPTANRPQKRTSGAKLGKFIKTKEDFSRKDAKLFGRLNK